MVSPFSQCQFDQENWLLLSGESYTGLKIINKTNFFKLSLVS